VSLTSQTIVQKHPRARIKEALASLRKLLASRDLLRQSIRRHRQALVLVAVAGLLVQFAIIPVTHILLDKLYPPVKEKRLFGLFEQSKQDERLESRKLQVSLAWWFLFVGGGAAGLILVAPRLLHEGRGAGGAQGGVGLTDDGGRRYVLRQEVGRGAMGVVYSAYDTVLQRDVAVKELPGSLVLDPERRERFKREALTLARLSHKGIVNIFDLLEDHDRVMLVMELVEGGNLDALLVPGIPMPVPDAAKLVIEMAEALGYIHAQGIVHRDMKPANVLIDASGHLKLTDFGLARLCQDSSLTVDGSIIGSPLYMSPEQAVGRKADHRSDIYALGVIFYQLLTGTPPHEGDPQEVIAMHLSVTPPPPGEKAHDVPAEVDRLVMQMLEKVADERIASCEEIVGRLKPFRT